MDTNDETSIVLMIGYINDIIVDSDGEGAFINDKNRYRLCVFGLFLVGEVAGRFTERLRAEMNSINWGEIRGMRNRIAHEYEDLDRIQILDTVEKDIPKLKTQLEELLKNNL